MPFPERLLLKSGPSELKSGPSDSPEGRPPKRKAPIRAGPRDEQVIGRRGPIRRASGPTCRTHRTAWGCFQSKHVRRHGAAHAEGTRKSVSVEGTFPPREAPLRFLCQASSARTYADSTPLSDDRPTSETPRPQAGRVQFRRLHARRGLGGAGGRSHRALVPVRSGRAATALRCGARPARLHARPAGALRRRSRDSRGAPAHDGRRQPRIHPLREGLARHVRPEEVPRGGNGQPRASEVLAGGSVSVAFP